ncbi:magnesium-translocating P-type ATPase [Mycoplasma sp. SG1]|uniref:magnesium-translocating P-type ATPase n=1 Tax=Mycoplasma sp. SG1 TaxID=2810348 RepID=UPI002025AC02|nr:magnesium-translocating P-type ATPase [Mycoplasma sp. SG1]URM52777.1 magnesium-translocating P-type ATPase [Mycoplasma sp. SG1]
MRKYSLYDSESCYEYLNSSEYGLSEDAVEQKLETFGKNELKSNKFSWLKKILSCIFNPFVIVLACISSYNFYTWAVQGAGLSSLIGAIIVALMILISVSINFFQELKSQTAVNKLRSLINVTASVFRYDPNKPLKIDLVNYNLVARNTKEIKFSDIVPGDIVYLSAGDMIPGDLRIIASKDLYVSQSSLTGESEPVEKHSFPLPDINISTNTKWKIKSKKINPLDLQNICYMGSTVTSGSAIGIVIGTGKSTYLGQLAVSLQSKNPLTNFDKTIRKISLMLVTFMLIAMPSVLLVYGLLHPHTWNNAFLFAISVAVGITPELLPLIVTANMSRGAVLLSKKQIITQNLSSVQNLGAIDVLCVDKTGTLTHDNISLLKSIDIFGANSDFTLKLGYLNSYFQTGVKSTIDRSIIEYVNSQGVNIFASDYIKIDEIPFSFARRRLTIILKPKKENDHLLLMKGSLEEVLDHSKYYHNDDKKNPIPIDSSILDKIHKKAKKLNEAGIRTLAVAYKKIDTENTVYHERDEEDLIFVGFLQFLDKPKKSAISAIKKIINYGVAVKVLTGDSPEITRTICKHIDLDTEKIIVGSEIEKMSDIEIGEALKICNLFAKLEPLQKLRIIRILKEQKHVVGFLGDGINDSPSLKFADVGISVNNASDIAKQSSDIILLNKNLNVIKDGIVVGRKTFVNTTKYLKITMFSNVGNIFSVLIASVWLPFVPMIPIQILFQNLLYDFSQILIPWDNVDDQDIRTQTQWKNKNIVWFIFSNAILSSLFDIITFVFLWYVLKYNNLDSGNAFSTGWFLIGVITQVLIIHSVRTKKIPFLQSRASKYLFLSTSIVVIVALILPNIDFTRTAFSMVQLPAFYYGFLIAVVFAYLGCSQFLKLAYVKIFKEWLI